MSYIEPPPPPLFARDDDDDENKPTTEERFAEFDAAHPEVWEMYQRFAYELRRRGITRGSTQQILGRVRWETQVNPNHDGGFKVDERFKKLYAKKLVEHDPSFDGFFEFREFGRTV
jgi:hypothetical protein